MGSTGKDSACPAGYAPVDKATCAAAARAAGVAAGANSQNTGWLEDSWPHVPFGCSIHTVDLTKTGPWPPHWNNNKDGENNGSYRVVCARTGREWRLLIALIVNVLWVLYEHSRMFVFKYVAYVGINMYVCMYVCMHACMYVCADYPLTPHRAHAYNDYPLTPRSSCVCVCPRRALRSWMVARQKYLCAFSSDLCCTL